MELVEVRIPQVCKPAGRNIWQLLPPRCLQRSRSCTTSTCREQHAIKLCISDFWWVGQIGDLSRGYQPSPNSNQDRNECILALRWFTFDKWPGRGWTPFVGHLSAGPDNWRKTPPSPWRRTEACAFCPTHTLACNGWHLLQPFLVIESIFLLFCCRVKMRSKQ